MPPKNADQFRYLSRQDVVSLGVNALQLVEEVSRCFASLADGSATGSKTLSIPLGAAARFVAKGGVVGSPPVCAIKWFGYFPGNRALALPDYHPMLLLNEATRGKPLALMDGTWISEMRTAAISAFAAAHLADRAASEIGFVACGAQAQSHFEVFRQLYPLARVRAYSRRIDTARAFCASVRELGVDADVCDSPRSVIENSEIVVSSIPHNTRLETPLRGEWLSPGAFASLVDRGGSWEASSLSNLDLVLTDDLALSGPDGEEWINFDPHRLAGDLADLSRGALRKATNGRSALIFSGAGIVDAAIAALVYRKCRELEAGQLLPL